MEFAKKEEGLCVFAAGGFIHSFHPPLWLLCASLSAMVMAGGRTLRLGLRRHSAPVVERGVEDRDKEIGRAHV